MIINLAGQFVTCSASRREVSGVIVRWDQVGNASLGRVRFEPGSLSVHADLRRIKLLVQHDHERPVGYMTDVDMDDAEARATFHVPAGEAGDVALSEAANGLRDGLSVGVEITEHAWTDDGVLIVKAGVLREVSLVSLPAIDDARVSDVAATAQKGTAMKCSTCGQVHAPGAACSTSAPPTPAPTPAPEPAPAVAAAAGTPSVPAAPAEPQPSDSAPLVVAASNPPAPVEVRGRGLDLRAAMKVAANVIASGEGHRLEAALGDIVPGDDAAEGVMRPQWVGELWQAATSRRPIIDALGTPRPLTGLKVQGFTREYTDLVDEYDGDKAAIHGAGTFGTVPAEAPAKRWAGGNDVDRAYVDLGSPDFLQDWFTAAVDEYREKSEAYAVAELLDAATEVTPAPTSVTSALAALGVKAASLGSNISFITFASDVWGEFVELPASDVPWWLQRQGTINLGTVDGEAGGLRFAVEPGLPAGTVLAGDSRAATWYEKVPPVRVQAVNIANGGIDLGVFGYGALLVNDARALFKAEVTPAEVPPVEE